MIEKLTNMGSFELIVFNESRDPKERLSKDLTDYLEKTDKKINLEMAKIKPTPFYIKYKDDLEMYSTKVTSIKDYFLSRYPITQLQYKTIMGNNPSHFKQGPNYPVRNISWEDAIEFCKRLRNRTNIKYTLPTEEQWDYAYYNNIDSIFTEFAKSNEACNAWEWCLGDENNKSKPIKGGYWYDSTRFHRSIHQTKGFQKNRYKTIGFRIALTS